eukprot:8610296-Alexandrium_andersonii.AAC.1
MTETEDGIASSVTGRSQAVPSLFRPGVLGLPGPMAEDLGAVFSRGRVNDHMSVNRFLMDQVAAWWKLTTDVQSFAANILRAAVSFLETHPYQFVDDIGSCAIDNTGWIPASSFYRFVGSICASHGVGKACVGLTQNGGMD